MLSVAMVKPAAHRADPLHCDAVVVLGAEVFPSGAPSPAVRRRVAHGVRALRRTGAEWLVVAGGVGRSGFCEASVMAALAVESGVPPELVVEERHSHNTLEQAVAVAALARQRAWTSVRVVSDRFHVPRAVFLFRRVGVPAVGDPVKGRGEGSRRRWVAAWLREVAAWAKVGWQVFSGRLRRAAARGRPGQIDAG